MHRHSTPAPRLARRPLALATALAALAAGLPASSASAISAALDLASGAETTGSSATYSFQCPHDPGAAWSAVWMLQGYAENPAYHVGEVTELSVEEGSNLGTGTFSVDYTDLPAGGYLLTLQCSNAGFTQVIGEHRFVNLVDTTVDTTTDLVVTPSLLFADRPATIEARVSGGVPDGGLVEFAVDGAPVGTVPVVDGVAVLEHAFSATATLSAAYLGEPGFRASTGQVQLDVVTDIVPGEVTVTSPAVVGSLVTVDPGAWVPSVADGTELTYHWTADGETVGTADSYQPGPKDVGTTLAVEVIGHHPELGPARPSSVIAEVGVVQRATMRAGTVTLDGTAEGRAVLGQPLTVTPEGWPADATLVHSWSVDGVVVPDATGPTWTPRPADLGKPVVVTVTASAPGADDVVRTLEAQGAVVQPTVVVSAADATVRQDVTMPVRVAGPDGAPVPAGTVRLTRVVTDGVEEPLATVTLDPEGAGVATLTDLPVGVHTIRAAFTPAVPGTYTGAETVTEVDVVRARLAVTVPEPITVPVATRAAFPIDVTGLLEPVVAVVSEDGEVLVEGIIPEDGEYEELLPVLAPGEHDLVLELEQTATTDAVAAAVKVMVQGQPNRATEDPTADLTTPQSATGPGQAMTLEASGFLPGETVAFYLHPDPRLLGTAVADDDGVAKLAATIPVDVPGGLHTVVATGGDSGWWGTLALVLGGPPAATPVDDTVTDVVTDVVTAWAPPPTVASWAMSGPSVSRYSGSLAATGSQTAGVLTVMGLLLAAGGVLVLVSRRGRAVRR